MLTPPAAAGPISHTRTSGDVRPKRAPPLDALSGSSPEAVTAETLDSATNAALHRGDLSAAAGYAERMMCLRHASRWYPRDSTRPVPSVPNPSPKVSRGKLRHDLEQLILLQARGVLPDSLCPFIDRYRTVLERIGGDGLFVRRELSLAEHELIGEVYGRVVFRPEAPRESAALSQRWSRERAQEAYTDHPIGVVVIDNVLSREALESLRRFCIESTIWFENRYSYGRLGAFFRDGFNCPLLVQLAEEFRAALPRIVAGNALQQLWAFKNEPTQPETLPHADFAAVNVNIWLTPEEANLDPTTGGMIIYDVPTPPEWDFHTYNSRGDLIAEYLLRHEARAVRIPYRGNRAIVFNSRYFHKTDILKFSPRYEDRRVNVTLLFGRHQTRGRARAAREHPP